MSHWADRAVFYHLYPLGVCGAPPRNDLVSEPVPRLERLLPWLRHASGLGATALYLGPVFEAGTHGYDVVDYFRVDRRLGTGELLARVVAEAHRLGLRVLLDGVFGHVGRDFWVFRELRERGAAAPHRDWFRGVRFGGHSSFGDPFTYEHWERAPELPQLQLGHAAVREHLLAAVSDWIARYDIDGLRLDAADTLDLDFVRALREHTERARPGFWLLGELVHGDYRRWVKPDGLHSATNYEVHKGLWSSHADRNFFEIAHSLQRQFGEGGLYRGLPLYEFADNHDVNRAATNVPRRADLFTLYCLLFTIPGVPSLYYGSEWGLAGRRTRTDDRPLRPCLDVEELARTQPGDLPDAIRRLIAVRRSSPALCEGGYVQLAVAAEHLAFLRQTQGEAVVVAVNAAEAEAIVPVPLGASAVPLGAGAVPLGAGAVPLGGARRLVDLLNPPATFEVSHGQARLPVPAHWARILRVER